MIAEGGAFTSHAAGWLGERAPLYALDALHRSAAYAWLGGVAHLLRVRRVKDALGDAVAVAQIYPQQGAFVAHDGCPAAEGYFISYII